MNCGAPFDRLVITGWQESNASPSSVLIPNNNGYQMLALGNADQVGAVIVTPQKAQQSSNVPFIVAAGAPLIGPLDGPLIVSPLFLPGSTLVPSVIPTLDLLCFESLPPFYVAARAPFFYAQTFTSAQIASFSVNVRGRRRVLVAIQPGAGTTTDAFTIAGYSYGTTIGASSSTVVVQSGSYATVGASNIVHQFAPTISPPSGAYAGTDVIDTLKVSKTSGASDRSFVVIVQAWD